MLLSDDNDLQWTWCNDEETQGVLPKLQEFRGRGTVSILEYETGNGVCAINALENLPNARAIVLRDKITLSSKMNYYKNAMIAGVFDRIKARENTQKTLEKYMRAGRQFDIIFCNCGRRFARALLAPGGLICYVKKNGPAIVEFETSPAASQTKTVLINGVDYTVYNHEFVKSKTNFDKIRSYSHLTELEREAYFWKKMAAADIIQVLAHHHTSCGGFLPLNCSSMRHVLMTRDVENLNVNIKRENRSIDFITNLDGYNFGLTTLVPLNNITLPAIIYCPCEQPRLENYVEYIHFNRYVYVRKDLNESFAATVSYCLDGNKLSLDNLIHLAIMVKNAGPGFRDILTENLKFIDEWTILDTGSTDETLDIIREVMPFDRGNLYCEPFINFRDSRNRCLELAGTDCAYIIMLDDTYVLRGKIIEFLRETRTDQEFSSFSIFIEDGFLQYQSNRVLKSCYNLRYIYRMHEIIEINHSGGIPHEFGYIEDFKSEYMFERSSSRKDYDLDILLSDLEDDPENPRTLYYLAETLYFRREFTSAFIYYEKRSRITKRSFQPEIQDCLFKMGLIAKEVLNDWEQAEFYFMKSYEFNKEKYEGLAMIAEHYYELGDPRAWKLFKECFDHGIPNESKHTFSRYMTIYNQLVPSRMREYLEKFGPGIHPENEKHCIT
jgi:hypothetical protein